MANFEAEITEITIESTGYGHKSPELAIAKIHKLKTTQYRPQGEMAAGHRIDKSPLLQHLDKCEEVVKTWPKWKRQSIRDAFAIPNLDKTNCQQ